MIGAAIGLSLAASAYAADPLPPVTRPLRNAPLSSRLTIRVREFRFQGNTAVPSSELQAVVAKYLNRDLSIEDLEQARVDIGKLYVRKGYVNSGAVLPDQNLENGVLILRIVEGKLTQINVTQQPDHHLRERYVRDRIEIGAGPPLNIDRLQQKLELLRQDPNIARVNAELRPGTTAGTGILDVSVAENNPYQLGVEFNNHRSPVVGAERVYILAGDNDVTGNGDRLNVHYGVVEGGFDQMRLAGANDFSVDYLLPVTPQNTTIDANYVRSDDLVVEDPFRTADISSRSQSLTLTVRQPLYRTPTDELAFSIAGALRSSRTTVLGRPFSFTYGESNGESRVTVIRFTPEYTRRTETETISLRATFSVGIDAAGSTVTPDGKGDSEFFAFLGQAQYVRRLGQSSALLILRAAAQFSHDALPPLEQFSVGGFDTVRGYRENRLVRDNGVQGTVEVQIPLLEKQGRSIFAVAPFFDCGYAFDNDSPSESKPVFISSVGVGFLFTPNQHVFAQLYYGYPFKHFDNASDNIQDYGLHFDLLLLAF